MHNFTSLDGNDFDFGETVSPDDVQRRLSALAPVAIDTLRALMTGDGVPPGVRFQVAQFVLCSVGAMVPPEAEDDDGSI